MTYDLRLFPALLKYALIVLLSFMGNVNLFAQDEINASCKGYKIKPSSTDASITNADEPNLVLYDPKAKQGKLMVFLTGTGGIAAKGPGHYFETVLEQGYRLISLSYVDVPAVAQVCVGHDLKKDPGCADEFRMKRIYGKGTFSLIDDQPQDAIVNRLIKLLQYLNLNDRDGNWGRYLENDTLKWTEIAFSGQSQGGGMSEYIGKHQLVYKVISFSGGWDWGPKGRIADWYSTGNVTPPDSWYATYNAGEPTGNEILKHYKALKIPESHIHAFDLPVRYGRKAHSEGISNPDYKPEWIEMLGRGN
jgi:hypothetical protein